MNKNNIPYFLTALTFCILWGGWEVVVGNPVPLKLPLICSDKPELSTKYKAEIPFAIYDFGIKRPEELFLGDSRVMNAIRPSKWNLYSKHQAYILGMPINCYFGTILYQLKVIENLPPTTAYICVTPLSIQDWDAEVNSGTNKMMLFRETWDSVLNMIFDHIRCCLIYGVTVKDMKIRTENRASAFSPFCGAEYVNNRSVELDANDNFYKKQLCGKAYADFERALIKRVEACSRLRSKGWKITFIRLPISESLRKIENAVCDSKLFKRIIEGKGFGFMDYSGADYQTFDGSHLTPEAAELFTHKLYLDMKYPKPEEDRAIGKY